MTDEQAKSSRVQKAAVGIEDDVISLNERLSSRAEGAAMEHDLRHLEALLFAAVEPIDVETLRERLGEGVDVGALLARLQRDYAGRGINLVAVAGRWRFQTAPDLEAFLVDVKESPRKLSKAALETLAIIAYHQPVTRPEIEDIRGVAVSGGTLDVLMELGWIRIRGRRRTPGRPVTYGTTETFLAHFNLEQITDLPGRDELKAAGLLDSRLPRDFEVPMPKISLDVDEDPIEEEDEAEFVMDFMNEDDKPDFES
ncbi:MAG TPA: SMC-Scp complex subunit ScpB [Hellea balneolensis]|uniref:SMC-Scp complex subunit ScpB n=1 Tax=Hellea balneolensis TaxID=287478 RepID=A0A7V5NX68_9PROT|nr:SMC-Scp complex subunit ScpB [Hellea balneolensis]